MCIRDSIGDDLHPLDSYSRVFVVSIGKAAHTMADALQAQIGGSLEGIVVSPEGNGSSTDLSSINSAAINSAAIDHASTNQASTNQVRGFRYFLAGHPTPNAESARAADAILKSLRGLDSTALVIFMISGGGSSLVERPIDDEISLPDLAATYRTLVHSGAPIAEINAIRKHLSLSLIHI